MHMPNRSACVLLTFALTVMGMGSVETVIAQVSAGSGGTHKLTPNRQSGWEAYELGGRNAAGVQVLRDPQRARPDYEQALAGSDQAVARASAFALGQLAQKELDDPQLAVSSFERGAGLGDAWSKLGLASLLATGEGATKDVGRAQALYAESLA